MPTRICSVRPPESPLHKCTQVSAVFGRRMVPRQMPTWTCSVRPPDGPRDRRKLSQEGGVSMNENKYELIDVNNLFDSASCLENSTTSVGEPPLFMLFWNHWLPLPFLLSFLFKVTFQPQTIPIPYLWLYSSFWRLFLYLLFIHPGGLKLFLPVILRLHKTCSLRWSFLFPS